MRKSHWCFVFGILFCVLCMKSSLFAAQPLSEQAPVEIPQMSQKAEEFYRSGNILWVVQQIVPILIFAGLLFTGISAKLRNLARRLGKSWFFEVVIYWVLFGLILFIIQLPITYYGEYARLHGYGLSSQEFGKWFIDTLKASAITLIVGGVIVLIVYYLIKKSPKRWWIYCALLTLPFTVLSILITPLWIDPLFNHYGPMKDKALEAKILHLADRAGINGTRVFEVDKSQDTSMVNAYVTGFGQTKRIVLWDTIIAKLPTDELLFVMGHEMGHYVLHHIEKDIGFEFALNFLLFLFLSTSPYFIKRYKKSFHIQSLSDIASLPLLFLMAQLFYLATAPISNAFSRHFEHEADRFGLEITQNNHAAAEAFVKLQSQNLGNPNPGMLYVLWRSTHPPLGKRITFCNTYHPWKEGEPLQNQKYIKPESH